MATTQQLTANGESVLLNIDTIFKSVNREDMTLLANAINKEIGDYNLNKEEIDHILSIMNVDALESAKWKNVADVMKYVSIFALAENNPEVIRRVLEVLLGILGMFFPYVKAAKGVLTIVPDQLFPVLIKIGGLASPDYLIYRGVKRIAEQKADKVKEQAAYDTIVNENKTNLIIVCKNRTLSDELSKLVKLEDDLEDSVVGVKDGTVHAIIWNEAAWEAFHDKLTDSQAVIIIGKLKSAKPLPLKQIRFDEYGVKYGWNNNIATITADPKEISKAAKYKEFLSVMADLQITESLIKDAQIKLDLFTAGKLALFPPLLIGDLLRKEAEIKKQQLLFGIYHFYVHGMAEFMNPIEP